MDDNNNNQEEEEDNDNNEEAEDDNNNNEEEEKTTMGMRRTGTNEIFFGSLRQWGVAARRMKPLGGGDTLNSSQNKTQLCLSGSWCGLDLSPDKY